jgi:hypothetical protein
MRAFRSHAWQFHVPLVAAMCVALILGLHYVSQMETWRVMTDELLYTKLAISLWDAPLEGARVRGEPIAVYSVLMPLLAAPLWGLLDTPDAFSATQSLHVLAMVSAAIPAALLTRELVSWRPAWWVVGSLTALTPWLALAPQMMTEAVAYPAFLWAVLAMHRAMVRPSPVTDLLALIAIAIAFLARTQFALLAVVLPVAILLHEVGWRAAAGPRRRTALSSGLVAAARGHRLLAGVFATAILISFVGPSLREVLGTYQGTALGNLLPPETFISAYDHLDRIVVGIGVVPAVLFVAWAAHALVRGDDVRAHAFAVLATLLVVGLTLVVASFVLRYAEGTQERYLFFVAPLFYVGAALAITQLRRPWIPFAVGSVLILFLVSKLQYGAAQVPTFVSPTTNFHAVLDGRSQQLGQLVGLDQLSPRLVIIGVTLAATAGIAWLIGAGRSRFALILTGCLLLAYQGLETRYVLRTALAQSQLSVAPGDDWIDQAVPASMRAGAVPSTLNLRSGQPFYDDIISRISWWDLEFWNKRVLRSYSFEGLDNYTGNLPTEELALDRRDGRLLGWGGEQAMVLSKSMPRFGPHSDRPVVDGGDQVAYFVPRQPRAAWATLSGLGDDGWVDAAAGLRMRLYPAAGEAGRLRRMTFTLSSSGAAVTGYRYRISAGGASAEGSLTSPPDVLTSQEETIDVCMSARPAQLRLRGIGGIELEPGRVVGPRVLAVSSEVTERPCP